MQADSCSANHRQAAQGGCTVRAYYTSVASHNRQGVIAFCNGEVASRALHFARWPCDLAPPTRHAPVVLDEAAGRRLIGLLTQPPAFGPSAYKCPGDVVPLRSINQTHTQHTIEHY